MNETIQRLTFASGDLTLEGVVHLPPETPAPGPTPGPAPGVVVCHPHPQYGGDMENNVVMAACAALVREGYAVLRFNTRGTGASEGTFDGGIGERDDLKAALTHLSTLPEVDESRRGIVGYSFGAMIAAEVAHQAIAALALISPPVGMVDLRVGWGCPTLVLGREDDNIAPADKLRVIAESRDVELKLVPGGDHSWFGEEDTLSEALGAFFATHLSKGS